MRYFEPTSITCLLEPWLRELGFSIFYGSILIKLYRILTEFQTRKAHRVCFRDKDQIVYLLAIVLIVVGYMSAWTALMVDGFFFSRQKPVGPTSNFKPSTEHLTQVSTIAGSSSSGSSSSFVGHNEMFEKHGQLGLVRSGRSFVFANPDRANYSAPPPNSTLAPLPSWPSSSSTSAFREKEVSFGKWPQKSNINSDRETTLSYNHFQRGHLNAFDGFPLSRVGSVLESEAETEARTSQRVNLSNHLLPAQESASSRKEALGKLQANSTSVGRAKSSSAPTEKTTSTFHYIEPDFVVIRPKVANGNDSEFDSSTSSSTLLNYSGSGDTEQNSAGKKRTGKGDARVSLALPALSSGANKRLEKATSGGAGNHALASSNLNWAHFGRLPNELEAAETSFSKGRRKQNSDNLLEGKLKISSAFEDVSQLQFSNWAPGLSELFAQNLNSFSDLFSSLLESERQYDELNDLLTYSMRCRKLTWDYVTELSKLI